MAVGVDSKKIGIVAGVLVDYVLSHLFWLWVCLFGGIALQSSSAASLSLSLSLSERYLSLLSLSTSLRDENSDSRNRRSRGLGLRARNSIFGSSYIWNNCTPSLSWSRCKKFLPLSIQLYPKQLHSKLGYKSMPITTLIISFLKCMRNATVIKELSTTSAGISTNPKASAPPDDKIVKIESL